MTMFLAPYTAIADIDGSPLDAGYLYLGEYGKNPESFPIEAFWDAEYTTPAAQPIRTRNGYPVRNGSPAKVYLKTAQHSIVIKNRNSAFILVDLLNRGWDASFVVDASGKNQQQINNELRDAKNINHAAFVPNGGGSVGVIGGTFRGFAEGINFIVDSAHDKFGFTDISKLDNYTVRVNHDAEFSKVGTLICTTDETLASMGVIAGASVGLGYSDVKIIAPLYFTCKGDGTITKVSPLFEGSVATMAGHNPAGGILRFSHPLKSVGAHQAMVSNRAFVDNIAKPMRVGAFNNDGGTYTQINAYGEQEDNNVWIKHNGTAFEAVQGINKASFSFSFNPTTGGLTITHQAVKSGAYLAIPIITPFNTTNRYTVGAISPTTTTVMCYDPAGNVVKTLDAANWSFLFSIKPATQELSLVPIPATNEFTVFVGNCYVPIDNLQKVSGGNIWLYGAMHK